MDTVITSEFWTKVSALLELPIIRSVDLEPAILLHLHVSRRDLVVHFPGIKVEGIGGTRVKNLKIGIGHRHSAQAYRAAPVAEEVRRIGPGWLALAKAHHHAV